MRRRFIAAFAASLIVTAAIAFLFFKTVYLPRHMASIIDRYLSALPLSIRYEIPSVGLFPPSLTFESIAVTLPLSSGEATFSSCTVSGLFAYLRGDGQLRVTCERIFFSLFVTDSLLSPSESLPPPLSAPANDEPRSISFPSIAFSVQEAIISFAERHFSFALSGAFSNDFVKATITPLTSRDDSFLTLTFSPREKHLTLLYNRFPIEPYTAPWFTSLGTYARGILSGTVEATDISKNLLATVDLSLEQVDIAHSFLDTEPFRLPFLRIYGELSADMSHRYLFFNNLTFSLGGVEIYAHGTLDKTRFDATFLLPETPLNRLATLVYNHLFEGFLMEGTLSASLTAGGTVRPGSVVLDTIGITGTVANIKQLTDRFERYKNGSTSLFTSSLYTPLILLPPYISYAVVLAEDAGFFLHPGIDFVEMDAAFKDNLSRRELRGGSTITQQLVKNLFLTRDKTILRKFREMLLAVELDATLSKERILELYLNLIEWGPNVFGIGDAARFYFGKLPEELLPHEAAWLASIIPNPKRYQHEYLTRTLSEARTARIQRLLDLLFQNGHLSAELYIFSYTAPLLFNHPSEGVSE